MIDNKFNFYEFFAGGGMARIGLGPRWRCIFANELCPKKSEAYRVNHHSNGELVVDDVASLTTDRLPGQAILSWASFPCQDLSLAGNGKGLEGDRSGTFWPFWRLMSKLSAENRQVPIIVLENVVGALSSNKGADFRVIVEALIDQGYVFGPFVLNAVHFLPQSRPRLFIVAVKGNIPIEEGIEASEPVKPWHNGPILRAYEYLNRTQKKFWIWWNLPTPQPIEHDLSKIIEENPINSKWHPESETKRLLGMMSETNLQKVKEVQELNKLVVGTIYKRTRKDESGKGVQRAEVRFDQISGCLRTPVGGSSRQIIMLVKGNDICTRLITPREAARLMGLNDNFKLPNKYNDAYHLVGDGLAVPVVAHLSKYLLTPLAKAIYGQSD